jgi:hypothetical protein
VCGSGLESNPPPVIKWTRPSDDEVVDGVDGLSILTEESSVRLEFNHTTADDNGTWTCLVTVEGVNVTVPGGGVVPSLMIGNFSNSIELTVVGELNHFYWDTSLQANPSTVADLEFSKKGGETRPLSIVHLNRRIYYSLFTG